MGSIKTGFNPTDVIDKIDAISIEIPEIIGADIRKKTPILKNISPFSSIKIIIPNLNAPLIILNNINNYKKDSGGITLIKEGRKNFIISMNFIKRN